MKCATYYYFPDLPYGYGDLAPYMSEAQLRIHYLKHHSAYVSASNSIIEKICASRCDNSVIDQKSILKNLSFNIGGNILHSLFWNNLAPKGKGGKLEGTPLEKMIMDDFKTVERFKKEFSDTATSVEGSGWAALTLCPETDRLMLMQIEKHNQNLYPGHRILLVLDVFEHAYYLDYKNDRAKYIESFWNIINWDEVNRRLKN
ncbi:MAG: superoxide dismutase [DPANN group archaeon]|nr:superoxide dismutase [DPANN group archaeon]